MKQINGYAIPALGIASLVAPEFAPAFGNIAGGLKTTEMVGKSLHEIEKHYNNKFRK
jgi:hypothetical protein